MAKRKRDMQLNFRVSAEEIAVIEQKMSQFGASNREAYLRKWHWMGMWSSWNCRS